MKIGDTPRVHGPEIWKPIFGQPDYEVSSHGRVRSFKRDIHGRILKSRPHSQGYQQVTLKQSGNKKDFYVQRLVALTFLGDPPPPKYNFYLKKYISYVVNHKDGNKTHNHVENLKWVTQQEDKQHSCQILGNVGRRGWGRGSVHPQSKLTEEDVLNIRHDIKYKKTTQREQALKFDVSFQTISNIVLRQSWQWLEKVNV